MAHEFDTDTLDDIKERDIFNLAIILKKKGRKYKTFERKKDALRYSGGRVAQILGTMGVSLERARVDKDYDVDADMKKRGIRIENRVYEEGEDEWRSGVFIYNHDEIGGFVGHPIYNEDDFKGYQVLCTQKL